MATAYSGQHFARVQATADAHLLRLYDGSSRCTGRFSSAVPIHSLLWLSFDTATSDKRQKKRTRTDAEKEPSTATQTALAVGTQDALIWLDVKGSVIKTLPSKSPVLALAWHAPLLWTASPDGTIQAWNMPLADGTGGLLAGYLRSAADKWSALIVVPLPAGMAEAPSEEDSSEDENMGTAAKTSSSVLVIAASNTLTLLSVSLPTRPFSTTTPLRFSQRATSSAGHTTSITSLHLYSDSPLRLTSSSRQERYLNLWSFEVTDLSLKAQLALEDPIARSCVVSGQLAAVTESGTLAVARYIAAPSKKKKVQPLKPSVLVKGDVVDVQLDRAACRVVRGAAVPVFQDVVRCAFYVRSRIRPS
jgi:hypothetical protein